MFTAIAPALVGCSTTATITRSNGLPTEAVILGGGPTMIAVSDSQGQKHWIARSEITDVDHPGNVHAVVGGLVGAYGLVNIGLGMPSCSNGAFNSEAEHVGYCVGVFTPAVIGAGMLIWGLLTHSASVDAERDRSMNDPEPEWDYTISSHKPAATRAPARGDDEEDGDTDDGSADDPSSAPDNGEEQTEPPR